VLSITKNSADYRASLDFADEVAPSSNT